MGTPTHIFAIDTLTMDYFFEVTPESELITFIRETLKETGMWPGEKDKSTIADPGMYTFLNRMVQNDKLFPKAAASAGGSAGNTLITALRALKGTEHEIALTLCTTISDLPSGKRIREGLNQHQNITVAPTLPPEQQEKVVTPSSYIFIENGRKKVAKAEGTGNKQYVTSDHIRTIFANQQFKMAFIPGTAVEKFDYHVANAAVEEAVKQGSDIIFALPTEFTAANRAFSGKVIDHHASIVLANMDELCEYYNIRNTSRENAETALTHLRNTLSRRSDKHPSAFISDGTSGAWIVTPETFPIHIPLWDKTTPVKDLTGAGDNFNAGALIGLILGFDRARSIAMAGHFGAALSNRIIQQIGTQLTSEPLEVLTEVKERFGDDYAKATEGIENLPPVLICDSKQQQQQL